MPENVLSWFLPPQVSSIDWYTMKGFDGTFGHDEAILGYDKDTQTAYFDSAEKPHPLLWLFLVSYI
jgi:hypothetical protein